MNEFKQGVPNNLPASFSLPFEVGLFFETEGDAGAAEESSDVVVEIYANSSEVGTFGLNFEDVLQNTYEMKKSEMSKTEVNESVKKMLQKFIEHLDAQSNDD